MRVYVHVNPTVVYIGIHVHVLVLHYHIPLFTHRPTATACLVVPFVIELRYLVIHNVHSAYHLYIHHYYFRPGVSQTSSVVVVGFSDGYIKGYSKVS